MIHEEAKDGERWTASISSTADMQAYPCSTEPALLVKSEAAAFVMLPGSPHGDQERMATVCVLCTNEGQNLTLQTLTLTLTLALIPTGSTCSI